MVAKKSRNKLRNILPWGLKRSDTIPSSALDHEQDSSPSSKIGSSATSNRQADNADDQHNLDPHSPEMICGDSPVDPESRSEHHSQGPSETKVAYSPASPLESVCSEVQQDERNAGMWQMAYNRLRCKAEDIVSHYEKQVSRYISLGMTDSFPGPASNDFQEKHLSGVDATESLNQFLQRWFEEGCTRDSDLPGGRDMESINSIHEAIERSREQDPDTLIAWAALCIAIQAVWSIKIPPETTTDIISYIGSRLEWYCAIACIVQRFASSDPAGNQQQYLHERIADLYEAILSILLGIAYSEIEKSHPSSEELEAFYGFENRLPLRDDYRVENLFMNIRQQPGKSDTGSIIDIQSPNDETQDHLSKTLHKLHAVTPSDLCSNLEEGRSEILSFALANARKIPDFASLFSETTDPVQGLCLSGRPGTGKTMLLTGVIWELSQPQAIGMSERHVSYFICSDRSARPSSLNTILKSLVWQILKKQPELCHHLDEQFEWTERDDLDDIEDLLATSLVFFRIVSDATFKTTFFVVDSLDQRFSIQEFLSLISTSIQISSSKARWLISVDQLTTESILSEGSDLYLRNMSLDTYESGFLVPSIEYASFLVKKLQKDSILDDETCKYLVNLLCENSNGNYLWMDIACRAIAAVDSWNACELLQSLPSEIDNIWIDRKGNINNLNWNTPGYCAQVLDAMAVVFRPLHLTELADLVSIPPGVFLQGVVEKCVCFLEIRENTVFFTCAAAKTFIRKTSSPSPISHAKMAQKCLESISKINRPVQQNALECGHYASVYWMTHLAEKDDTKWHASTINSVVEFARNNTLEWMNRLVEDECLPQALAQARILESVLNQESKHIEAGAAALLLVIQDIHQVLASRASGLASSDNAGVCFYPNQDLMNQHLKLAGHPTLSSPLPPSNGSLVHVLKGHTDWIRSCTFSPDAQLIASASDDYTVRIWNTATGRVQHVLHEFDSWIYAVAWSPVAGGLLAAASGNKVFIFSMATGNLEKTLDPNSEPLVKSLTFSADGVKLAAATHTSIIIWNISSWIQTSIAAGFDENEVDYVEFTMAKDLLLSKSQSRVTIWDTENDRNARKVDLDEESWVYAASLSPDGRYVALATESWLKVRSTDDQSIVGIPLGKRDPISSLAFSPDGTCLAVASEDGQIRILKDPWADHPIQTLEGHSRPVYRVSFSASGNRLISSSSDRTLRVWDVQSETSGQTAHHSEGHLQAITCLELSPDGRLLASASEDKSLCLWDGCKGTFKCRQDHGGSVALTLQFSNDGNRLVTGARDGVVRLWNTINGTLALLRLFEGHCDWVRSVILAPDENWIASGSDDSTVHLWSVMDQSMEPTVLTAHEDYVRSVAFSTDGTLLASGGDDRRIEVWNVNAKSQEAEIHSLKSLTDLSSIVAAVIFTPGGSQLIASFFDSKIVIWDTKTWSCTTLETSNIFQSLRIIPDEEDLWLETEIGPICLQPDVSTTTRSDLPQQCLFGISRDGWWITYNLDKRLFFLPEAYWPDPDERSTLVRGARVAIGCLSGQVFLFNFG